MTNKELLQFHNYDDVIVFDNPSYEGALIGVSHDGRAIYSMDKMIKALMIEDKIDEYSAVEFIEYNTIRSLPYQEGAPIVMYDLYNIGEYK